jgi:Cytochrome P460
MYYRSPAIALGFAACTVLGAAAFGQSKPPAEIANPPDKLQELPEYTASGELVLPKGYRNWIYVGSPLTPNALNDGHAAFPEYHNVYIEPGSYAIYKKTGVFPEQTMFYKELQLALKPAENPDGSRTEPSGRGYFPGALAGAEVSVKDSKRFAASAGWGYFEFGHSEPKLASTAVRAKGECAYCHIASAKRDLVWTQFYRILDEVPIR